LTSFAFLLQHHVRTLSCGIHPGTLSIMAPKGSKKGYQPWATGQTWSTETKGKGIGSQATVKAVAVGDAYLIAILRPYPGAEGEWFIKRAGACRDPDLVDPEQMAHRLPARPAGKVILFVENDPTKTGLPQLTTPLWMRLRRRWMSRKVAMVLKFFKSIL
jgi:hypothetical protein